MPRLGSSTAHDQRPPWAELARPHATTLAELLPRPPASLQEVGQAMRVMIPKISEHTEWASLAVYHLCSFNPVSTMCDALIKLLDQMLIQVASACSQDSTLAHWICEQEDCRPMSHGETSPSNRFRVMTMSHRSAFIAGPESPHSVGKGLPRSECQVQCISAHYSTIAQSMKETTISHGSLRLAKSRPTKGS